ncbi:MAG: hypothetical protein LBT20_06180 [Clostridiales bacterium]|jgi:hypothetical protein|nr:hypothetical protein [Clostridiales bacterium]
MNNSNQTGFQAFVEKVKLGAKKTANGAANFYKKRKALAISIVAAILILAIAVPIISVTAVNGARKKQAETLLTEFSQTLNTSKVDKLADYIVFEDAKTQNEFSEAVSELSELAETNLSFSDIKVKTVKGDTMTVTAKVTLKVAKKNASVPSSYSFTAVGSAAPVLSKEYELVLKKVNGTYYIFAELNAKFIEDVFGAIFEAVYGNEEESAEEAAWKNAIQTTLALANAADANFSQIMDGGMTYTINIDIDEDERESLGLPPNGTYPVASIRTEAYADGNKWKTVMDDGEETVTTYLTLEDSVYYVIQDGYKYAVDYEAVVATVEYKMNVAFWTELANGFDYFELKDGKYVTKRATSKEFSNLIYGNIDIDMFSAFLKLINLPDSSFELSVAIENGVIVGMGMTMHIVETHESDDAPEEGYEFFYEANFNYVFTYGGIVVTLPDYDEDDDDDETDEDENEDTVSETAWKNAIEATIAELSSDNPNYSIVGDGYGFYIDGTVSKRIREDSSIEYYSFENGVYYEYIYSDEKSSWLRQEISYEEYPLNGSSIATLLFMLDMYLDCFEYFEDGENGYTFKRETASEFAQFYVDALLNIYGSDSLPLDFSIEALKELLVESILSDSFNETINFANGKVSKIYGMIVAYGGITLELPTDYITK